MDTKIDYGLIPYDEQRKLDQKAYRKYYDSCFQDDSEGELDGFIVMLKTPLTFNSWYGSSLHKKFITPYLRKIKLEKIKKAEI
jgi:hypothetical protein